MSTLDCSLQTPPACTGTVFPSDAGKGVFDGLSTSSAVLAVVGAGALIASLLFAVFAVRAVGTFFRAWRELRGWRQSHPSGHRAAALQRAAENDLDGVRDVELDAEDDAEASDEDDHDEDSPGAPEKHQ